MAVMSFGKTVGQRQAGASSVALASRDALEIELAPRSVRRLAGDHRGLRITCTGAALWITQDGDPADYLLGAAEQFTVTMSGPVVLQGMQGA